MSFFELVNNIVFINYCVATLLILLVGYYTIRIKQEKNEEAVEEYRRKRNRVNKLIAYMVFFGFVFWLINAFLFS